jgi:hypothetical protein
MRNIRLPIVLLLPLLIVGVASAQGHQREGMRAGACFYEHGDYQGRSFCLAPGESAGTLPAGFDRAVTAVRVFGGAVATAYRDRNFGGDRWVIESDVRDARYVSGGAWNDKVRSVRVDWRGGGDRDRDRAGDHDRDHDRDRDRGHGDWRTMRSGACFFLNGDFQGESFCLRPGEEAANLPAGFDRQITAIKLIGDAVVTGYRDRNFEGDRWILEHDVRDARYVDGGRWNDKIRSLRVDAFDDDYNGGRRAWRGAPGVCFYQDGDFQGEHFCIRAGEQVMTMPQGFDRTVTAMRVFGNAVVTVYRDRNLEGERQTYQQTVRDFRFVDSGKWNDRIRSARVDDRGFGGD